MAPKVPTPLPHGLLLLPALVLSLAVAACGKGEGTQPPRRDWLASPAIVEVDGASDVFVLGDVHGDYGRMVGLVYFVDVGMSRGVGDSEGALLRITGDGADVLHADGSTGQVEQ